MSVYIILVDFLLTISFIIGPTTDRPMTSVIGPPMISLKIADIYNIHNLRSHGLYFSVRPSIYVTFFATNLAFCIICQSWTQLRALEDHILHLNKGSV